MNNLILRCRTTSLLIFFLLLFMNSNSNATHLMGGSMTYEFLGMSGINQHYKVTLKIYRYCDPVAGGTAPLDFSMMLGIYLQDPLLPNADKNWYSTENLSLVSSGFITPPSPGVNCPFNSSVCVEEGIYEADFLLPPSQGGYHLMVERCCRNGNIVNLSNPGSIGQTYYCFIPADPVINSSPQFTDIPVPYICSGDTVTIVNNAVDPDGDILEYSFQVPYSGYSSSFNAVPDPMIDNNPYGFPIPPVLYNPGYSVNSPFGAGGYSFIDPVTGLTKYYLPNLGFYVVAIEIKEYRNGVLIAAVRRDLQLISIACPVNAVPLLSNLNGSGQSSYTITEGQTICFPVTFTDPNGDSLYMTSSGSIFNGAVTIPPASLANAQGDGIVTSQFCWSTDCGHARPNPYQFNVAVLDNGCPPKQTNQIYSITVNPAPGVPQPAVTIQQNPPGPICTGTSVTFTALPTFGGPNPVYQWQLNGVNVGGNSNTWTSSTLNDGDIITVTLTSNSACVSVNNAVSPPVVMVVNPFAAPAVTISPAPSGPICAGTNVTFTANPVNPGPAPVYQWTVNGVAAGTNSPTFSSSSLGMGSTVGVTLTADPGCPAASSNIISMIVNPLVIPSVLITSSVSGSICPGDPITFTAFPTGGGTAPAYQWQVNGANVGTNSNTYTSSTLASGDNVQVLMTSNENCTSTPNAASNVITITVTLPTAPSVSIVANPAGPVCEGDNIIFTATPVSGGLSPSYQWLINGVPAGAGSVFSTSSLNNGDDVQVILTSSLTCLSTAVANSNIISVIVNPGINSAVSITASPSLQFCEGTAVTFTAAPVNGGTNPFFQWQVNGAVTGTNSSTFTTSTLNDGDIIRVSMTSNATCVSPTTTFSNLLTVDVLPLVTPSVTITSNPSGIICQGESVTFSATQVSGGLNPVYQWLVNNIPVGTNSAVYTSSALNDGDVVKVRMTSSASCPSPATTVSNLIVMNVDPVVIPSVSISVNPQGPVCEGTSLTFNSNVINGGTIPAYQWYVNGIPAGTNQNSFTSSALSDGDSVRVRIISNANCVLPSIAYSDTLIAAILPIVTPQINITQFPPGPICDGDSVTFNSVVINGGNSPDYQWFLNNSPTGLNAAQLSGVYNDGDSVHAVLITSELCPSVPTDTSGILVTVVNPNLTPSVTITANPAGPVCPGDLVTFTANAINGGSAPIFQWQVNGSPAGPATSTFTTGNLVNGDQIRVWLTSSESCLTDANVPSNKIVMQVLPIVIPQISISVLPAGPVCAGDSLSFTAVTNGGGPAPQYQWRINGSPSGVTNSIFTSSSLSNGDVIDVIMTSSAICASPVSDTSNAIAVVINPMLMPSAVISADPPGIFCDGTTITYTAVGLNGGSQPDYQWLINGNLTGSNNDTLVSSLFEHGDTLSLIFTSSETCLLMNPVASNEIIIERLPPLQPVATSPAAVCEGEEIHISSTVTGGNGGPYYYAWDNGLGNLSDYTFIPQSSGIYTVTVSDSCSTPQSASVQVIVNPLPEPAFSFLPVSPDILNPNLEFTDLSVNAFSWQWQFGDLTGSAEQHPVHTYTEPGYYTVGLIVTSAEGCTDSIYHELYIANVVTYYIPNSFTPNGDGKNDYFGVTGYSVSGYEMVIYSRWGEEIFNSSGSKKFWDGNDFSGNPVQSGVYVYKIRVLNDPQNKLNTGTVTLIR